MKWLRWFSGSAASARRNAVQAAKRRSNSTSSTPKRVEALKWVVHLVGDLHQPLHAADRGDKGGNGRLVFHPARREAVSLHFVWDTLILRDMMARRPVAQVADGMEKAITTEQRKQWAQGTPEAWTNECHKVAVEKAYKGVPADGPPPRLERQYLDAARGATAEQLKRAGVRLAAVLNGALK